MASEKNPGIHFYSGFKEKNTRGGAIRNPKKNPGIDFYSGFPRGVQSPKNVGIDFYSGFRTKIQVYTFIVASGKKHKGVQFEILKNPGIDFYSGFRKTSQGGVQI